MYFLNIDFETIRIAFLPLFLNFHPLSFYGIVIVLICLIRPITPAVLSLFFSSCIIITFTHVYFLIFSDKTHTHAHKQNSINTNFFLYQMTNLFVTIMSFSGPSYATFCTLFLAFS